MRGAGYRPDAGRGMKILLLAPHPFYQARGTPIAVDLVLRVLSGRGDRVEVVTFHEGEDVSYPGVTLHRIHAPPGVRGIRPGFSVKKLVCDGWLLVKAWGRMRRFRPDMLHAVEESVFLARWLGKVYRVPYVYDMDSCLSRQLTDRRPVLRPLLPVFRWMEGRVIRGATAVLPVCPSLAETAASHGAARVVLLPDITLLEEGAPPPPPAAERQPAGLRVMYIGNLEPYQGVGLLLEAFARARQQIAGLHLTVIGGTPDNIARYRARAEELNLAGAAEFAGPRPVAELGACLAAADILVSPRTGGENTPMKIYSYLDSGKPVVATDLPTHTQVLHDGIAVLAPPEPDGFARALADLAGDQPRRRRLGKAARAYARDHHSFAAFSRTLGGLYDQLAAEAAGRAGSPASCGPTNGWHIPRR